MPKRNNENASRIKGATRAARTEYESASWQLVKRVNVLALVGDRHDYTKFIDSMNEQIEQYSKQVLNQWKSQKTKDTKQIEDSGECKSAGSCPDDLHSPESSVCF